MLGVLGAVVFVMLKRCVRHPMLPLIVFCNGLFMAAALGGIAFEMALLDGLGTIRGERVSWGARVGMLLISMASVVVLL